LEIESAMKDLKNIIESQTSRVLELLNAEENELSHKKLKKKTNKRRKVPENFEENSGFTKVEKGGKSTLFDNMLRVL
jgi:hypothetical protein